MFAKLISKIFSESKETQAYRRMCEILRETLLPSGFTESQMDIGESLSKQSVYQKGANRITLYYDMRDREYALLTPNVEQPQEQAQNQVLFSLSFPEYNEGSVYYFRSVIEQWLKKVDLSSSI
jgi:hypothetical protein